VAPGAFIVFEGPEGGGKTLQAAFLADWLRAEGHEVVQCREPGGTALGERIRDVLLGRKDYAILPEAETLLLSAARAQLVRTVIQPALRQGAIVICDRFAASTLAYQGGGSGLPEEALGDIARVATNGLQPDLVILLDLPVEVGLRRRLDEAGSVNRIDLASRDFHERVRAAFRHLAADDPARWTIIDATRAVDAIARDVRDAVRRRIRDVNARGHGDAAWDGSAPVVTTQ
jgi:dTMP kinase